MDRNPERKRQEQVKLYTAQVAQVQQTQQAINQAYAYQQQQFNQWAQGMSGSQQWPDATGNAAASQQSAANPTPTTEPIKKRSKREIVGNFFSGLVNGKPSPPLVPVLPPPLLQRLFTSCAKNAATGDAEGEQVPIYTEHLIHAGMYSRTITIMPPGIKLIGALDEDSDDGDCRGYSAGFGWERSG